MKLVLALVLVTGCATDTECLAGMGTVTFATMAVGGATNVFGCTPQTCAATPREQGIVFGSVAGFFAIAWAVAAMTHYDLL